MALLLAKVALAILLLLLVMVPAAFSMAAAIAFVENQWRQRALDRLVAEVRDATKGGRRD